MTKLVKEGLYVTMLHKTRAAVTTGKVADKRGYRKLNSFDSILYRKSSGVIIFSFTRMHVHEESSNDAIAIPDLIGFYGVMPNFGLPRFYFNPKHGLR